MFYFLVCGTNDATPVKLPSKVGPGWESGIDVGPMISKVAKERAERLIQESQDAGADVLLDGRCVVDSTRRLLAPVYTRTLNPGTSPGAAVLV